MDRLKNKVALITGSAVGIGQASAKLFAQEGSKVVIADMDAIAAEETVQVINRECGETCAISVQADVTREEDCRTMIETAIEHFGKLDILFNNAGVVVGGAVHEIKTPDWDYSMAANVRSIYWAVKYALPHFRAQGGGVIINTASVAGLMGLKDRSVYSASKAAVIGVTRAIAMDYVKDGIRCNCLAPGTVETPSLLRRFAALPHPEEARQQFIARQPMGRLGKPEDVAGAALYLASDESSFVTGITLIVDGGMSL